MDRPYYSIYPYLKSTAPYIDPLYAIVSVHKDSIKIEGIRSEFAGPSPYDLGYPISSSEFISTPTISDCILGI